MRRRAILLGVHRGKEVAAGSRLTRSEHGADAARRDARTPIPHRPAFGHVHCCDAAGGRAVELVVQARDVPSVGADESPLITATARLRAAAGVPEAGAALSSATAAGVRRGNSFGGVAASSLQRPDRQGDDRMHGPMSGWGARFALAVCRCCWPPATTVRTRTAPPPPTRSSTRQSTSARATSIPRRRTATRDALHLPAYEPLYGVPLPQAPVRGWSPEDGRAVVKPRYVDKAGQPLARRRAAPSRSPRASTTSPQEGILYAPHPAFAKNDRASTSTTT